MLNPVEVTISDGSNASVTLAIGNNPVGGQLGGTVTNEQGNPVMEAVLAMHDLRVGKYDLVIKAGTSYTTQREEAVEAIT